MRYVFVKHYLNDKGMEFFKNDWFPKVNAAIKVQPGFVDITTERDESDDELVHIKLCFEDEASLSAWVATKIHDDLIDNLDDYRVRDWEYAAIEVAAGVSIDKNSDALEWHDVTPKTVVYSKFVFN